MASEPEPSINRETLKLLVDLAKDTPGEQVRLGASMDGKLVQVFAAATILIGLAATASGNDAIPSYLVFAAVGAYVGTAAASIYGLWVRTMRVSDTPNELWTKLYDVDPDDARHSVIADLADGYPENEGTLDCKRLALKIALILTGVEAFLMGVAVGVALT